MRQLFKLALSCTAMFAAMTATSCEDSNTDKTLDPEAPEFNITTATPTGGSIAVSMDDAVVSKAKQGSVVTIKATADEGYRFTGWVLSGDTTPFIASAPQTTFRMPAEDIEVSATFEELPKSFAVNFTASSTGGAVIVTIANEPIASGDVVLVGTDVTITARPAANYYFSGWSGVTLNDNTARTATFKMPASAVTISAAFTETPVTAFALNYTATYPGGTVSVKVGNSNLSNGGTVDVNADVTITASPANGYRFTEWGGVTLTDKTAATATFKMPASNVTLSAIFTAIPTYNLTAPASVTGNGRVEVRVDDYPITGTRAVYAGQTIRVISIPDGNWTLKGLTITGISTYDPTSRNIEFAMPANAVTISNVVFEVAAQYYPVNVKAPTGGRIDVSVGGSVLTTAQLAQVQVGSSVTFTAVPADAEYTFKTWNNISGITIANLTASTHTFTMPANAVSIGAEFLQKTYTLALTAPTNGSVVLKVGGSTVTSGSAFPKGTVVTMEATPASGHDFKEWTVSSSPAVTISPNATTSPATFAMQASNATVVATFEVAARKYLLRNSLNMQNGTCTFTVDGQPVADRSMVAADKVVTVTAVPADGFKFQSLRVYTNSNWEYEVAPDRTTNPATFVMASDTHLIDLGTMIIDYSRIRPASTNNHDTDAVVIATFVEDSTPESILVGTLNWATRNVDTPGTFADSPESYGLLYQHGVNAGWLLHATEPRVSYPADSPAYSSATNVTAGGVNAGMYSAWYETRINQGRPQQIGTTAPWTVTPCPEGYRLPTDAEFAALVSAATSNAVKTVNGIAGRALTFVGGGELFFPFAGYSNKTSLVDPVAQTTGAWFWTQETNGNQYPPQAKVRKISYSDGLINGNQVRYHATSLRCVK